MRGARLHRRGRRARADDRRARLARDRRRRDGSDPGRATATTASRPLLVRTLTTEGRRRPVCVASPNQRPSSNRRTSLVVISTIVVPCTDALLRHLAMTAFGRSCLSSARFCRHAALIHFLPSYERSYLLPFASMSVVGGPDSVICLDWAVCTCTLSCCLPCASCTICWLITPYAWTICRCPTI